MRAASSRANGGGSGAVSAGGGSPLHAGPGPPARGARTGAADPFARPPPRDRRRRRGRHNGRTADHTTFLRANPAADTLRLVFADGPGGHGDPLGKPTRVRVGLEPVRDRPDAPRVRARGHRADVVLGTPGGGWLARAADVAGGYPAFGPVFRRGLPERVCLPLDRFLDRGTGLFAACPTVREVIGYGAEGRGAGLAACPHLAHVETLGVANFVIEWDGRECFGDASESLFSG